MGGGASHRISFAKMALALISLFLIPLIGILCASPAEAIALPGHSGQCPDLHLGSTGSCVIALQWRLDQNHIQPLIAVDGIFGKQTYSSVTEFQRIKGLTVDGIVGPRTARALDEPVGDPGKRKDKAMHSLGFFTHTWNLALQHAALSIAIISCSTVLIGLFAILIFARSIFADKNVKRVKIEHYRGRPGSIEIERFPNEPVLRAQITTAYLSAYATSAHQLPSPHDVLRAIDQ
jgi:hypothetical protein